MTTEQNATNPTNIKENSDDTTESKWVIRILLVVVTLVVVGILFAVLRPDFLFLLQNTAITRGFITFLVAFVTVSIAIILAVWVLITNSDIEELKVKFSSAKDILATLVGILGTILGFYFGSLDSTVPSKITMSEVQFINRQAIVFSSGGTAPYRYTVTIAGGVTKAVRISNDGWLFEAVPSEIKPGSSINIEVVDAKDIKSAKNAVTLQ
ncbi:hypothetical protein A5320_04085 [Rheinheimera sp. SA_1]|uniref:hypothetical protein n=1 Tax=Rheinheimera sp. SA_1 TaxID=1827365 RepID=UPI0007FBA782|nr:hypothetical protein [Rheinheimera sp. SA_1]OBP16583.1 hypothetical protein A5320_04085 [Rheinheimera sp. SA_1]